MHIPFQPELTRSNAICEILVAYTTESNVLGVVFAAESQLGGFVETFSDVRYVVRESRVPQSS